MREYSRCNAAFAATRNNNIRGLFEARVAAELRHNTANNSLPTEVQVYRVCFGGGGGGGGIIIAAESAAVALDHVNMVCVVEQRVYCRVIRKVWAFSVFASNINRLLPLSGGTLPRLGSVRAVFDAVAAAAPFVKEVPDVRARPPTWPNVHHSSRPVQATCVWIGYGIKQHLRRGSVGRAWCAGNANANVDSTRCSSNRNAERGEHGVFTE